jgi:hypothetical protein
MRTIAIALGLFIALAVNAEDSPRAKFVGQRVVSSYPGSPILVCEYRTAQARYEVVAAAASCAPYLVLSAT